MYGKITCFVLDFTILKEVLYTFFEWLYLLLIVSYFIKDVRDETVYFFSLFL